MALEAKRLILRPFTKGDFEAVHSYACNPDNVKYMVWGPNSADDTKNFLAECVQRAEAKPRVHYDFAIVLRETGRVIGGCGIYLNNELNQGMLGWILHMDYWKQGFGTEFAAALIKFGFEELKLHRIWASCNTENYGSYRVMENNNMRREATHIRNRFGRVCDKEEWYSEHIYAILREEWTPLHE